MHYTNFSITAWSMEQKINYSVSARSVLKKQFNDWSGCPEIDGNMVVNNLDSSECV